MAPSEHDEPDDIAGPADHHGDRPRNVLFVTVDQWRADCLSAAGHPVVSTPSLDALAAEGVRFARHYAQCAPCSPSRASLLTGMYMQNHRVVGNGTPLDARHTNMAVEARRLGFDPWLFGYTDTAIDPRSTSADDPRLRTYEAVMDGWSSATRITEHDPPWVAHLASLGYEIPEHFFDLYQQVEGYPGADGRGSTFAPTRIPTEHCETRFLTDAAIHHLRARVATRRRSEPGFFLHVSYLRPHAPWVAPEGYHDLYDPADVPAPVRHATVEEEMAEHPFLGLALSLEVARAPAEERELRQTAATYYGLMRLVDDELGRLFGWLRANDLWDDTLVIVTSDHGEQMGDHHFVEKLGFFDQSYHVPCIVRDPRAVADAGRGTVVEDAFTENVDVLPTILDWLGVDRYPLQCDGRSLLPFVRGEPRPEGWRDAAHWEFDFRSPVLPDMLLGLGLRMADSCLNTIRTATHKYVHFPNLPPVLYDLAEDPGELHNRAGDPALAAVQLSLVEQLLSWRMVNDERELANTLVTGRRVFRADDRLR